MWPQDDAEEQELAVETTTISSRSSDPGSSSCERRRPRILSEERCENLSPNTLTSSFLKSALKNAATPQRLQERRIQRDLFSARRGPELEHAGACAETNFASASKSQDAKHVKSIRRQTTNKVKFERRHSTLSLDSTESTETVADDLDNLLSVRKPPTSSSPQKLTKTNFMRLQRELEVKQAKLIELTEQGILRAKDKNLRKMIHTMSSFVFVVLLGSLMYSNYVMLAPHLNAVSMAGLLALVLSSIRRRLTSVLAATRKQIWKYITFPYYNVSLFVLLFASSVAFQSSDLSLRVPFGLVQAVSTLCTLCLLGCTATLMVLVVEPRALTASILTVVVLCAICIPLYFAIKQCAKEAEVVAKFFMNLIDNEAALQSAVETILASSVYRSLHHHVTNWLGDGLIPTELNGSLVKEDVGEKLKDLAQIAGANMEAFSGKMLSIVSNLSNIAWAFTTFSTTLFYLLNNESPWEYFNSLSPLSPTDNAELYQSMKRSTVSIMLCSICIFTMHFGVMYCVLGVSGFPIVAIPSFATGLFAVMPLWGTYVVFVPVASILWAQGSPIFALAVCAVELTLVMVVDPRITSHIPGDSHFVALSLVAGLYAFGPLGSLYGPLLVCLLGSVFEIYLRYLKKPLNHDVYSPNPRRKLFV